MIIKYRVHEVAKDFNVPSKEVIEIIMAATGAEKKHMTALNEDELNVVFEHFSRNKQVESFDEYLAGKLDIKTANDKRKRKKEEIASEEAKPAEKEVKTAVKPSAKKDSDNGKGSTETTRKETSKTLQKVATPITKLSSLHPAKKASSNTGGGGTNLKNKPAGRVIDTRAAQVDIEKYNEKYDRLASEKMKIDNTVRKQKITQKSQQRGKPRNSRKETEAERLRRIALERKNRPITVLIPENITVGELASRLKATAAEVIKKLMMMGIMASTLSILTQLALLLWSFTLRLRKRSLLPSKSGSLTIAKTPMRTLFLGLRLWLLWVTLTMVRLLFWTLSAIQTLFLLRLAELPSILALIA